jgi:hypothetical protein
MHSLGSYIFASQKYGVPVFPRKTLTVTKDISQKSPSPFPLPIGERGRGEGEKVTPDNVQQPTGKAICIP